SRSQRRGGVSYPSEDTPQPAVSSKPRTAPPDQGMLSEEQRSDRRSGQGVCDGPGLQRVAFQTTRQIYFSPEHNLRNKTGLLCSPEHGAGAIAPPSRRIDLPQCRAALWGKAIHIAGG